MLRGGVIVLAIALGLASPSRGQDVEARLTAVLDGVVAENAPSVALGVVKDGQIIFAAYRGLENLETRTPAGPDTRYNIASNAKQFTALVALDLVRKGRLDLDADVRRLLPDALPLLDRPITVRQLIAHTSGLRDVYDLWSLEGRTWWRTFVDNDDALDLLARQSDLNFEPGLQHLYSNSNYILLTRVVAAASGREFADQASDLLDGWGMTRTRFATDAAVPVPNRARPYADFGSGWIEYPAVTSLYGDGWLFTTLDDQLRFEQAVQAGEDALISEAQTPLWPTYGYGLEVAGDTGARHLWHDGSTGAQGASLSRFPDCRLSVVAMSNNGSVSTRQLVTQAAEILLADCASATARFPDRPAVPLEETADETLLGVYRQTNGGSDIRIVLWADGLRREIEGRDPVKLVPESAGLFQYETNPALRMAFDRDEAGRSRLTIYAATQPPAQAIRFEPAREAAFEGWIGTFRNSETGAVLQVAPGQVTPSITLNGQSLRVRPLGEGALVAGGYVIRAETVDGKATSLLVDGGRIRNVRFVSED